MFYINNSSYFVGLMKLMSSTPKDDQKKTNLHLNAKGQGPQPKKQIIDNYTARATIHLNDYTTSPTIDLTECPLSFWASEAQQNYYLKIMARKYLGIPATSVSSESASSTTGNIVSATSSRLSPDKVDKLAFIRYNFNNFED